MPKQITLELPEWANWIAHDMYGRVSCYENKPDSESTGFYAKRQCLVGALRNNTNWRDSKINLNTHGAYIDADGILHRCELVPDMLKEQA